MLRLGTSSLLALALALAGCESSPLGPDMSDKNYAGGAVTDGGGQDVTPGQQPDGGGTSDGTDTQDDAGSDGGSGDDGTAAGEADSSGPDFVGCERFSGHHVWYYGSDVELVYECDETVSSFASDDMPAFLTATVDGAFVTFSGTAPSSTSDTDWTFTANGLPTSGGAASINTTILNPSSITRSIVSSPDVEGNNDGVIPLEHTATLASAWDGEMTDVAWSTASITHDLHGLTLQSPCSSATTPYVCDDTLSVAAKTIDSDTNLRWQYSAFDQGTYYLSVAGQIEIEGGTHTLSAETATFEIPIQSNGKVQVAHQGDPSTATLRNVTYNYDVAIGAGSTATTPQVGVLYFSQDSNPADAQFKRLVIDRTDDPTGGATGVTASTNLQVSNGAITYSGVARSLTHSDNNYNGDWIVAGIRLDGTGQNVYVARIPNSATPALEADVDLTDFDTTGNNAKYIDMTRAFDDGGTTRFGIAYVRSDATTDYLTIAKIDPTGTDKASFVDDSRYDTDPAGNQYETTAALNKIDRVKIRYIDEDGGRFYVAYRNVTDLYVLKIASEWNAGTTYNATITSAPFAGVFADATGTNFQSLDLAVGTSGSATVVGVTYRDSAGDCYFRKLNEALSTAGTAVALSEGPCWFPSIQWIEKSGKFVVTWGETNTGNGNAREIYMSEITLGGTDSASTPLLVAETGSTTADLQNLDTDYYADGDWMAVFYRLKFTDSLHIHGFHVPGR